MHYFSLWSDWTLSHHIGRAYKKYDIYYYGTKNIIFIITVQKLNPGLGFPAEYSNKWVAQVRSHCDTVPLSAFCGVVRGGRSVIECRSPVWVLSYNLLNQVLL